MMRIFLTEEQLKKIKEGITWGKNPNGSVDLSVNQDMTDRANKGKNTVDTRVFGNKMNVMHGDDTGHFASKSLYDFAASKSANIQYYNNVIKYIQGGRQGNPSDIIVPNGTDPKTVTTVYKWFAEGKSDNWILDACKKTIERTKTEVDPYLSTMSRISNEKGNRIARYTTGTVTGTDIKYIALFTMTDFNFSDAIKHGTVRQNGNTDNILGINKDDREKGEKDTSYSTIDVTYDNGVTPDIAQNFSLKNVQDGHYKQQFGLNGEGGYTTISQFLDKSINYASYALNKEKFIPDFIVCPPSSSQFNNYYCTNLSRKLNVPFVQEFFKRNLINVKFGGDKDVQSMLSKGFSQKDIMDFENHIKNVAYKEIAYYVSEPIRNFIYSNKELFSNISLSSHSREKTPINEVFDCVMIYAYRVIKSYIENGDVVEKHLIANFQARQNKLYQKSYDSTHIMKEVSSRINLKIGKKVFTNLLIETLNIVRQYSDILKEQGYKLRFDTKRFKVTQFSKQFRPFLHDVYVIADKELTNGELLGRYQNAKFLIFDEDINSGATMKLCIDALEEKLPMANHKNIMCLVNAYSANGF